MKSLSVRIISTILSVPLLVIISFVLDFFAYPELYLDNENLAIANSHSIMANFILAYIFAWCVMQ